jgi:hypothetical protein
MASVLLIPGFPASWSSVSDSPSLTVTFEMHVNVNVVANGRTNTRTDSSIVPTQHGLRRFREQARGSKVAS